MLFNRIWNTLARASTNHLTKAFRTANGNSGTNSNLTKIPLNKLPTSSTIAKPNFVEQLNVFEKVNNTIANGNEGRLFAVVHLCGKQFKVTAGDIILVEGYWPPTTGDKISLDKVLVAGGEDFSLIGRPIIQKGLVDVQATIIEKTLTHTKTHFRKKRRKQYVRFNFYRSPNTMIMINSIDICRPVNGTSSSLTSKSDELQIF